MAPGKRIALRATSLARFVRDWPDLTKRSLATSPPRSAEAEDEETAPVDPFLRKLQQKTEASYLELLSRKEDVPQTEEDRLEDEAQEVLSYIFPVVFKEVARPL